MIEQAIRFPFPNRFRARECGFRVFRGKNPAAAETFVTLDKVYFALVLSG